MSTCEERIVQLTKKLVSAMIDKDAREWPPGCTYFAYQPIHPTLAMQECSTREEKE